LPADPAFPVRFDEAGFDEDLLHVTPQGRAAAIKHRALIEQDGLPQSQLIRCEDDAHDATSLGGCVKTRLPWPDGPWGLALTGRIDEGRIFLQALAFGERHPTARWRPSVNQIGHRPTGQRITVSSRCPRSREPDAWAKAALPRRRGSLTRPLASCCCSSRAVMCCST
jgi:hypothetical protein